MQERRIELSTVVERQREEGLVEAREAMEALLAWVIGPALEEGLHRGSMRS